MKLSISLSEADVAILDQYVAATGLGSRSAAVQRAIRLLGDPQIKDDYAAAWQEWEDSGDAGLWDTTAGDGLSDAPR